MIAFFCSKFGGKKMGFVKTRFVTPSDEQIIKLNFNKAK